MSPAANVTTRNHIFLYGPSGSGKSTVGKILADNLCLPFIDLDWRIEQDADNLIPMIFDSEGESGFREREARAFEAVIKEKERVISLGGGTLIGAANYDLALSNGTVVVLQASFEKLTSRLVDDGLKRPLLVKNPETSLQTYLEDRKNHYSSFPISVNTTHLAPAQVALEIQKIVGRYHLQGMASRKHPPYDLLTRLSGLNDLGWIMKDRGLKGPVVVVTDKNVGTHYLARVIDSLIGEDFKVGSVAIDPGERHKNITTVFQLWDAFLGFKIERGSTILALGGGMVLDLVGFAASTYLRGVPWISVPTSLLAMVDAGLGGKTAVNLPQGKNLVGAFHPPRLVLVDPEVLLTLPQVEFTNGMAEVVKHAVISDPGLFDYCQEKVSEYQLREILELLSRAIAVKVNIIEQDPYEDGIRAALNYGHTVGHGVEMASGFKLRHGESVSIGMVVEARMSEELGLAEKGLAKEIADKLAPLGLPVKTPIDLDRADIIQAMKRDKKSSNKQLNFSLPLRIGRVKVGVSVEDWESYIRN